MEKDLKYLDGKEGNLYLPLQQVGNNDLVFRLGDNYILITDCSTSRYFEFMQKGICLDATEFYREGFMQEIKWTKPIRVKIAVGYDPLISFTNVVTEELVAEIKMDGEDGNYIWNSPILEGYKNFDGGFGSLD